MSDLNTAALVGRLAGDASISKAKGDVSILTFTLATNEEHRKKDTDERVSAPSFFRMSLLGERAERLLRHMTKGRCVSVEGRLRQRAWKTESGESRSLTEVVPPRIGFIGAGKSSAATDGKPAEQNDGEPPPSNDDALPYDETFLRLQDEEGGMTR